jgi:hypothetical protein
MPIDLTNMSSFSRFAFMETNLREPVVATPYLRLNFEAMLDDDKTLLQRLGAAKGTELNLEDYTRTLALVARSKGISWSKIAEPLGITRQAAYARYGLGLPDDWPADHLSTGPSPQDLPAG